MTCNGCIIIKAVSCTVRISCAITVMSTVECRVDVTQRVSEAHNHGRFRRLPFERDEEGNVRNANEGRDM